MRMRISFTLVLGAVLAFSVLCGRAWSETTPSNVKLMILPFEINADPGLGYLNNKLPEMLGERLRSMGFQVASQDRVYELINRRKVDFLDLAVAKELASMGEAQFAIYGSLSQAGQSISLDARVVDSQGVKSTKALFVTRMGTSNVPAAVEELAQKVKNSLIVADIVADIEVRGMKTLDKDIVLMRMKLQKGDPFDVTAVNEEIKRIFELGYFDDVKISAVDMEGGKRLVVEVEEKPMIQAISVEGAGGVDSDDILGVMSTKTGNVLNPKLLADDMTKIRELYRKEGYYLAKVSHDVQSTGKGTARLVVLVDESQKLYISDISIEGNTAFSDSEIKSDMVLEERNWLSWIFGTGVLEEKMLDRDAAHIEDFYANHGYVDAKVAQPNVEFLEDGIHITFTVVEGERFHVGSVGYTGDLLLNEEELKKVTKLDDLSDNKDYFDRSVLRDDTDELATNYNDLGYAYAEVEPEIKRDDAAKSLDVVYHIRKGDKIHIRRVQIEGNTRTRDNVIRRYMALNDGDLFSGTKLKISSQNLEDLDYFESADIETVPTENPYELDLKVKVKEKSTGTISGGVGFSSYSGVYVGGKLSERNLFGMGYQLEFTAAFSAISVNYIASFVNPSIYDTKLGAGTNLYFTTYEYPDFNKQTIGGMLRFFYPIGNYSKLYWGYRLDRYRITDLGLNASTDLTEMTGNNWSSVLSFTAERDSTNRANNPTSGSKNSASLEYGGGLIAGDDNFIKLVYNTHWFFEMPWFKEHVLHLGGEVGGLFDNSASKSPPVFEHFFLGGINSIRGYDTYKVATRDPRTGEVIGGDKEFYINVEYLFPLSREIGLVGLVFFDAGDAWRGGIGDVDVKKSVGVGLRWYSPMGPLRVEYGYGLDKLAGKGDQHKIEFTIGQSF
jgi:outer membrane protein insertion porin family